MIDPIIAISIESKICQYGTVRVQWLHKRQPPIGYRVVKGHMYEYLMPSPISHL